MINSLENKEESNQQLIELEHKKQTAIDSDNFEEAIKIRNEINKIKGNLASNNVGDIENYTETVNRKQKREQAEDSCLNGLDKSSIILLSHLGLRGGIINSELNREFSDEEYNKYVSYVYDILNLCRKERENKSIYLQSDSDKIKDYFSKLNIKELKAVMKIFTNMKQTTENLEDSYSEVELSLRNFEGEDLLEDYNNMQSGNQKKYHMEDIHPFIDSTRLQLYYFKILYSDIIELAEKGKINSLKNEL